MQERGTTWMIPKGIRKTSLSIPGSPVPSSEATVDGNILNFLLGIWHAYWYMLTLFLLFSQITASNVHFSVPWFLIQWAIWETVPHPCPWTWFNLGLLYSLVWLSITPLLNICSFQHSLGDVWEGLLDKFLPEKLPNQRACLFIIWMGITNCSYEVSMFKGVRCLHTERLQGVAKLCDHANLIDVSFALLL